MITVYTTPTCVFCKAVKQYLKDKKVEFKEKDLTQDQESAKWVYEHTGQMAVPVTVINDTIIVGFDRPQIDAALAS
jgi:glutaredoxin 3